MIATLTIKLDFESWCDEHTEPTNEQEWLDFFSKYFLPDSSIIGNDDEEDSQMIVIKKFEFQNIEISEK